MKSVIYVFFFFVLCSFAFAVNPVLWSTFDNQSEIEHPRIGVNGTMWGTNGFLLGKFKDGWSSVYSGQYSGNGHCVEYDDVMGSSWKAGTIEFWTNITYNIVNGQSDSGQTATWFIINDNPSSVYATFISTTTPESYVAGYNFPFMYVTHLNIAAGHLTHLAVVWNDTGILGGSDTMRLYKDGVVIDSTTDPFTGTFSSTTDIFFGGWGNPYYTQPGSTCFWNNNGIIDNPKIYNYAKTNFSDRFYENGTIPPPVVPPSVVFNSQYPSDMTFSNIVAKRANITYNISKEDFNINYSSIYLSYKTNSSSSDIIYFRNGTSIKGWQKDYKHTNISKIFKWIIDDNKLLPATYNYDESLMENYSKSVFTLNNPAHYLKMRLFNVSSSKSQSLLEIYARNASGSSPPLLFYYCNSSYVSGNPISSANCVQFYSLARTQPFNHTHTINSKHHVIPIVITAGHIGGVKVTATSYFLFRTTGTGSNGWNAYYISNISRADTMRTSTNNGAVWSNLAGTLDSHLHQFDGTDTFRYYACASDVNGNQACSNQRTDLLELGGMKPTQTIVYSPGPFDYISNLTIRYYASISPNGYSIGRYNISLFDDNYTFVNNIISNNSPALTYFYDITPLTLGQHYIIGVDACDTLNQCSGEAFSLPFRRVLPPLNLSIKSKGENFICVKWQ